MNRMHLITQTLDCTKSLALLVGWLAHSLHLPPLAASCVVAPAAAVDMMEEANPAQFLYSSWGNSASSK